MDILTRDDTTHGVEYVRAADARAEMNELKRIAAERILAKAREGRPTQPLAVRWARLFVRAHKPLGRPLGTGER